MEDLADWYVKVMALPNPIRRAYHLFVLYTGLRSEDARTIYDTEIRRQTRHADGSAFGLSAG